MPVNTCHAGHKAMSEIWRKCRDVFDGQEAMQEPRRAEIYLPRFKKETPEDYTKRLRRAVLFNAFFRTVDGLTGLIFRRAPTVEVSSGTKPMLADITCSGVSLEQFAREVATESLQVGRVGVLVDYPRQQFAEGQITVQQAQQLGARPKMAMYKAESIVSWACAWVNNEYVLTRVVLEETECSADPADEFVDAESTIWRVLDLFRSTPAGPLQYRQRIFKNDPRGGAPLPDEIFFPVMNGVRMGYIPFVFISSDNCRPDVELPPLLDLVNLNISHYQTTADLEHGAYKTALPQPYATGIDATEADSFYLGGGKLWCHPVPEGTFGMLEYSGQGLQALEARLKVKESQMAVMGARMLEQQKSGVEAAETAAIHRGGEQSALAKQASTIDAGIQRALIWFDTWAGGTGKATFTTNKDFIPVGLDAQQITALVTSWQAGALSSQELFDRFVAGGVIRDGVTYDEHEAQVEASAPTMPAVPAVPAADDPGAAV